MTCPPGDTRGLGRGRRILFVAGFAMLAAPAATVADRGGDLERLRAAIADSRERVAEYEQKHRNLLETLEALDRSAAELYREVAVTREFAAAARAEYAAVESEAAEIERQMEQTERALGRRAMALYKSGDRAGLRVLFSSTGIQEFLARFSALHLLAGRDAELLERRRAQSAALVSARERTRQAAQASSRAASQARERSRDLVAERAARQQLVTRLHADRTRERAALVEFEKAARALEETLANLHGGDDDAPLELSGPTFASLQHGLPPPVDAPISRGFGRVVDDEFFTETFRTGVEYDAPRGAPVRAVAQGVVRFAGWFRGFGRMVILDHGDGFFSVLGHLSEMPVAVGDRVPAGAVIGAVGDTGSLSGPKLYFEIRRGRDPVDPGDWLRTAGSG